MKKLFTFILVLVSSAGTLFAGDDWDYLVQIGKLYYHLTVKSKTAEVIENSGNYYNLGDIIIPSTVEYEMISYRVTSIEARAFWNCTSLTSIEIPNSVTSIGVEAFYNCTGLTSVTIGNSVTSIEGHVFELCESLTSIEIPNSVTSIGEQAFRKCSSLTSVTIPNSVTYIAGDAFDGCYSLPVENNLRYADTYLVEAIGRKLQSSYIIKEGTRWIGGDAFSDCERLISIKIPNSVTSIGYRAFSNCDSLTSVTIGNSVTSIGESAFDMCTSLTSVTIPNGVKSIGKQAFSFCRSLISIEIPNSVTYIGRSAFSYCRSLKSVRIPDGVTCIYENTFSYSGIASITIPEQIVKIESWPFSECDSLSSVVWNAKKCNVGSNLFDYSKVQALVVGEEVESLPQAVLYSTNDGYDSDSLKSVVWNAIDCCIDNTSYTGPNCDGSLPAKGLEKITFGNKVERIPGEICRHSKIKSLVIPNSVKKIGLLAFGSSDSLTTVILGSGVTELESYEGFWGYSVFPGCNNLTFITCYATTPPKITESFNYKRTKVYVPAANVDAYKSTKYWKDCTILPISASDTEISTVTTTATENSVDITWPSVSGAATYELVIKDKEGKVICTLIFNNNGQLTSIVFKAPSRDDAPQKTQAKGFSFTITGLEPGTEYDLIITAKNESGQEIDKKNISFHTNWPNGIEDIHIDSDKPVKVLMDGQIYILRGEHVYDAEGKMVK